MRASDDASTAPAPRLQSERLPRSVGDVGGDVKPPSRPPPSKSFVESERQSQAPSTLPRSDKPLTMRTSASKGNLFHAQVGASVGRDALEAVLGRLILDARKHFHNRDFEQALTVFRHSLSIAEKTASKGTHAEYGAIMHNVASCLHCLGDFEGAKEHYLAAMAAFQKHPPSRVWTALYGDVDKRRCEFVRERLVDIEFGRKPDLDKYLDGSGYKREVTDEVIRQTVMEADMSGRRPAYGQYPPSYGAGYGFGSPEYAMRNGGFGF